MELEDRMLFSAVPLALAVASSPKSLPRLDALAPTAARPTPAPSHWTASTMFMPASPAAATAPDATQYSTLHGLTTRQPATLSTIVTPGAIPAGTAAVVATREELVFVDPRVENYQQLVASLLAGASDGRQFDVVMLDPNQDGVAQIAHALAGLHNVAAIHVLSHGGADGVELGNVWLTAENVAAYSTTLAAWGAALAPGADILLYGCDVAGNAAGRTLVDQIHALTGDSVAASTNATGDAALGGDWTLEYAAGRIRAGETLAPAAADPWDGLLTTVTTTFQQGNSNAYAGAVDTTLASATPNAQQGGAATITAAAAPGQQGLLEFSNLFGNLPGQIPYGSTITSATLTVYVTSGSSAAGGVTLNRMLASWSGTSTWNSLAGGVQADGSEAMSAADATLGNAQATGSQTFSGAGLAATVQAWANGAANNGWVILNNQSAWTIASSEAASASQRPLLSVTYTPPAASIGGSETLVNTTTAANQITSAKDRGSQNAIARDASGNYVVVWSSQDQDGSGWGVYARRFDASGNPLTAEILVNQTTTNDQQYAQVACDGAGNFAVTWTSSNQNGQATAVYARQFSANGTPLGNEFQASSTTSGAQTNSVISMDSNTGEFVIAWQGSGPGDSNGIFYRRFAADGTSLDASDQLVNPADGNVEQDPAVTMDATGRFVIAWVAGNYVYFQRYTAAGATAGSATEIDTLLSNSFSIAIASDAAGDFAVAYREQSTLTGVWIRGYHADGSNNFGWQHIDTGDSDSPSLDMASDGSFVVVYQKTGGGSSTGIYAQKLNADGSTSGSTFLVNQTTSSAQVDPSVAVGDLNTFDVVWSGKGAGDSNGVFVRQYALGVADLPPTLTLPSAAGTYLASASPLIVDANALVSDAGTANFNGGKLTVSFAASTGTASDRLAIDNVGTGAGQIGVSGSNVTYGGTSIGTFAGGGNGTTPLVITLNSAATLGAVQALARNITFSNVAASPAVTDRSIQFVLTDATAATSNAAVQTVHVIAPPVANNDTGYQVYANGSLTVAAASGVLGNDTDPQSDALTAVQITSTAHGALTLNADGSFQYAPTLGFSGTDTFTYVANNGYLQSTAATVTISVLPPPSLQPTGEFLVNTNTTDVQETSARYDTTPVRGSHQSIALRADGSYVVVWSSDNQDGSGWGVYGQMFASNGTPIGSEFRINQTTAGDQKWAYVSTDRAGDFVVVWDSVGQDGSGDGVFARRYSASGTALGGEFQVNTYANGTQDAATVAMQPDGGFIIAWAGAGPTGSQQAYARRYDAAGNAQDATEWQVAANGSIAHYDPAIAVDAAGNFTIFWDDSVGVNFRQFSATGTARSASDTTIQSDLGAGDGAIAMASDGSFVAVWRTSTGNLGDGSGQAVMACRYDASGNALGAAFVVSSTTSGDQTNPSIGMDAAGNFIVVWEGNGVGDSSGVFAQKFNANGTRSGGEFLVNQTTAGTQHMASVAMSGPSNFVVVWSGQGEGDSSGVFARQYGSLTNTAPVLAGANNLASILENPAANNGTLVSSLIAAQVTDPDPSAQAGMAVTGVDNTHGTWQYSLDGGTTWTAFGTPGVTAATLLPADATTRVRFVPNANWWGTVSGLSFRAWDRTTGTIGGTADTSAAGGSNPFSAYIASSSIAVTWVNQAPQGTNDAITMLGNSSYAYAASDFGFRDPNDSPANTLLSVKITTLPGAGTLTDNGVVVSAGQFVPSADLNAGKLVFTPAANATGANYASFTFQVRDNGGTANGGVDTDPSPRTMQMRVVGLASAGGPYTIAEGGTLNLDASASLPPANGTPTYAWDVNNDGTFADASGATPTLSWNQLQSLGINNHGAYTIAVQMSDGQGHVSTSTTTLTVTNVGPTLAVSGSASVGQGVPYALSLSATDPGLLTVNQWTINWGDGTIQTLAGNPSSAVHTYTGPGMTYNITAAVRDADGTWLASQLIVGASANDALYRYAPTSGAFLQQFGTGNQSTTAFTLVGPDGLLYVSADGTDDVKRYNPTSGALVDTFIASGSGGLNQANGMAFGPDGNLYIASMGTNQVLKFNGQTGAFLGVFVAAGSGGLSNPTNLLFGPDGFLYVSSYNNNSVLRYNAATGAYVDTFVAPGSGGLQTPEGLAFGPDGNLYVASYADENSTGSVLQYNGTTGAYLSTFVATGSGGLSAPVGIAFGPDGNLYVSDELQNDVLRYNGTTGAYLNPYVAAGNGGLQWPWYLTFLPSQQVTIQTVNHAPQGTSNTVTTLENAAYTFAAADFGFSDPNDSPANGLLAVKITALPAAGALTDNGAAVTAGEYVSAADIAAGKLVFAPAAYASGSGYTSFTFQVQDNGGTANSGVDTDPTPRTMTVNVTWVNQPPQGTNNTVTTLENTSYAFAAADFGFHDPLDSPGNALQAVKITALPAAGMLTDNGVAVGAGQFVSASDIAAGRLIFTPAANVSGMGYASFTFQVQDNGGTANGGVDTDPTPRTMSVNVTWGNQPPQAADNTVNALEDTPYTFAAADFGFRDPHDAPANSLQAVEITTLPTAGTLTDRGIAVSAGQFVSVADVNAGWLLFTPAANANGAGYSRFTFQVQDDGGTANGGVNLSTNPNTMTIDVTPVNDPPQGTDGSVTALENHGYAFAAADFGFRDPLDSPANVLQAVEITTLPVAGTLTDRGIAVTAGQFVSRADLDSGALVFTPAAYASGAAYAAFTFQVQDNGGTANGGIDTDPTPRTMNVNVTWVNQAPQGAENTVATLENAAYTFSAADFGFHDPHDAPTNSLLAVKIASLPAAGALTDNGVAVAAGGSVSVADIQAGRLVFTPAHDANGAAYAAFTFQVQDNGGTAHGGADTDSMARTMSIAVTAVNQPPVIRVPAGQLSMPLGIVFSTASGNSIRLDDPDAGSAPVQLSLAVSSGTLTLATTRGVTFIAGSGTHDTWLVATGTLAALNAALDGMQVQSPASAATLSVSVNDLGHSGTGGPQAASAAVSITQIVEQPISPIPLGFSVVAETPLAISVALAGPSSSPSTAPATAPPPVAEGVEGLPFAPRLVVGRLRPSSSANGASPGTRAAPAQSSPPRIVAGRFAGTDSAAAPQSAADRFFGRLDEPLPHSTAPDHARLPGGPAAAVVRRDEAADYAAGNSAWKDLDVIQKQFQSAADLHDVVIESALSVSTGLTVGYVIWMLRGGMLLSSFLAQMPAWKLVDPLVILSRLDAELVDDAHVPRRETLETIVESLEPAPAPEASQSLETSS